MHKQGDEPIRAAMNTRNEAEANHALNVWLGAVLIYLLQLGRKPFHQVYAKEHRFRNGFIGWLVTLVIVLGGMGLLFYFGS